MSKRRPPTFNDRVRAFRKRGGEVWAIDPRAMRTTRIADRQLAPRPGSDVLIFAWLTRELLRDGFDADELETACDAGDVEHLRTVLAPFDLRVTTQRTRLEERDLLDLLAAIKQHGKVSVLPGAGISSPDVVVMYC